MAKPRVIVLAGYGLNCEEETSYAFQIAGGKSKIVHINDVIDGFTTLSHYQILAIPGGFSYGDDTGAGNAYALKIKNHLWEKLLKFINRDSLVIGICNGCQILINLGLIPALNNQYGERTMALTHNDFPRYLVRWVDLKITNCSPWLKNIKNISLPIAHGEGKFVTSKTILKQIIKKKLIAAQYTLGEMCRHYLLPANPNGSIANIAALTDESKKILGIMPHPERAIFFHQLPNWSLLKENLLRENKNIPKFGPGLKIFRNSVKYFQ